MSRWCKAAHPAMARAPATFAMGRVPTGPMGRRSPVRAAAARAGAAAAAGPVPIDKIGEESPLANGKKTWYNKKTGNKPAQ